MVCKKEEGEQFQTIFLIKKKWPLKNYFYNKKPKAEGEF